MIGTQDADAYVQGICAFCGCSPEVHHLLDGEHFSCVGPDRSGHCPNSCANYLGFLINDKKGYVGA